MKKLAPSLIAIVITISLYNNSSYAIGLPKNSISNNPQCLIDVPRFDRPLVNGDINTLPVNVEANQLKAFYPSIAIYNGEVLIEQGNRTVQADKVTIDTQDNNNRIVKLEGDITYQDNLIQMKGDVASMNLNNNDANMSPSQYQLVNRLGRGNADQMKFEKNRYIILKNGNYTSCPVNDSTWNIKGTTVIHDNEEQLLEVWNAIFSIGKVPVLYSPYLQLPTGDKRRSGLLMPNFSYDSIDGIDFSIPVYWNIAPNYDATFTPRVLQKRGVQLQTEFRYLNELGLGTLAFDWLQHDSKYSEDRNNHTNGNNYDNNSHRWLFHWKNEELINYNWRFYADTTRVSDNQYLTNLNSKYASQTAGYLTQFYKMAYNDESWDVTLGYRHFQPFHSGLKNSLYQTEPQLDVSYYNNDLGPFKFRTFSQISRFLTSGENKPKAWRTHIEPTLNYTLTNSWSSLTSEVGFMATHYNQDNIKKEIEQYKYLNKSVNRFLPKFSIDGKVIFERDIPFIDGYTQTLEPRIKYIYIPYRNQSNISNYDSTILQSDYIGLFRDQPYSGLDRIASTNKISTGLTTRFYNENKIEKFNLSIGQITYFTKSKTSEHNNDLDENSDTGSITWASDNFWRISDDIIFRSGVQYDTRIDTISLANTIFEYRPSGDKLMQLSYRYANRNYIGTVDKNPSYRGYKQDISQAGIMTTWPLSQTVSAVGSYYYDVKLEQTTDSFVGLHYSDCCWGMTVQYGRKLTDWDNISRKSKYENKLSVNFELKGLGNNRDTKAKMLNFGKLPYTTAFE
ncbi:MULTISPECIES: LPS assembly protein LptD [unclassified Gilliamella]|uniref:LPS assembly protein LptD n=1 Tax=unclassified Gilliamella TaxID=2685620 RepID=UPI0013259E01|nr:MULTISPECIES: LPS assembly protein LptD [unclassified Gilliamella]MWN31776.1 LPS assembly protein LptD [Gilliamella sp. Pra-s60]MWP28883.1 LPS assembly protein LptD [Gilliamella sp. Pra-s54]